MSAERSRKIGWWIGLLTTLGFLVWVCMGILDEAGSFTLAAVGFFYGCLFYVQWSMAAQRKELMVVAAEVRDLKAGVPLPVWDSGRTGRPN